MRNAGIMPQNRKKVQAEVEAINKLHTVSRHVAAHFEKKTASIGIPYLALTTAQVYNL